MKKDIIIPQIDGVSLAVVHEFSEVHRTMDWNVYLINENDFDLEMIMITSSGWNGDVKTSEMKHKLAVLPQNGYAKIEYMLDTILEVMNSKFFVTFFANNKMYEKTFIVKKNTVKESTISTIKALGKKGVQIKG
ncbi:MAG: hypothetical protein ACPG6V_09480 [Flavobacteriales bacterium]